MPTSKMPTILNDFSRGTTPAGVTVPCGAISVTLSPTKTRSMRARSAPRTTPNSPGRRSSRLPLLIVLPKLGDAVLLVGQDAAHQRPLDAAVEDEHRLRLDERGGGADVRMLRRLRGERRPVGQFAVDAGDLDVRGDAEDARRSSFWKPFITDSTTISAATPRPMPSIEISEMNEMKWLRRLARV